MKISHSLFRRILVVQIAEPGVLFNHGYRGRTVAPAGPIGMDPSPQWFEPLLFTDGISEIHRRKLR